MTETGLDECINSVQLFGTAFNVFRCDRGSQNSEKRRFGGVLVAVAQRHNSVLIDTVSGNNLEQVCVSISVSGKKVLLCAIYIPPDKSRDVTVIEAHLATVRELCSSTSLNDIVLLCGDYNQPSLSWGIRDGEVCCDSSVLLPPSSSALVDGMDYLNLRQANLNLNHNGRLLDLMFCTLDSLSVDISLTPLVPVDVHHPPLEAALPVPIPSVADYRNENENYRLDFKKLNFSALNDFLDSLNWDNLLSLSDVDQMASRFCEILNDWFCANVPRVKPPLSPAWSTPGLRELKRTKNSCQRRLRKHRSIDNKRDFQRASNSYRSLNASLYKSYVLRMQTNLRRNPGSFWKFVDSKRKSSAIPVNVHLDEDVASSAAASCELFAKHFKSVFTSTSATDAEADAAVNGVPTDVIDLDTFLVTPEAVIAVAKRLKSSYSPGPDGIPANVLRRCATVLAEPLCRIFNKSFEQQKFPAIWKQSYMFPVHKKGDRKDVKNYRGITNLSASSKLFEILVSDRIRIDTKNYISPEQHGFVPGRSVATNLLDFTSTCISHFENKAQVDVVYTDIKAAFDRIDHRILLRKLSRLGATDSIIAWLSSYLTSRTLRVKLHSHESFGFSCPSGVPQGSNLGPLLFAIFFNDVTLVLLAGGRLLYADDLKIFLAVRTWEDCRRLQAMLDQFMHWCRLNKLTVSITKCSVITFHRIRQPIQFDYTLDGDVINRVDEISDLGVLLDTKLTFNLHYSAIISKANRQLGFISKISKDFTDPYCLKSLYCALVRPILENAAIVWTPYQLTWNLRIERIQKRFLRMALRHLPWRDPHNLPPYQERCRLLNLDTLDRRRKVQQSVFVAKLLNGEIDSSKLLAAISFRTPSRSLRSAGLLSIPFHRTTYAQFEPMTYMKRTFILAEDQFEFSDSSSCFKNKILRSDLFR